MTKLDRTRKLVIFAVVDKIDLLKGFAQRMGGARSRSISKLPRNHTFVQFTASRVYQCSFVVHLSSMAEGAWGAANS